MGSRMMSLGLVKIYICSDGQDVFSPRKRVEENEEVEEVGEVGENRAAKKIRFSWILTC